MIEPPEPEAVDEVEYTLHAPYRDILPARDVPSPDAVAAAVRKWCTKGDRWDHDDWVRKGCPPDTGPVDGRFYICREVKILRDRAAKPAYRKEVKAAALRARVFVRAPPPEWGIDVPDDRGAVFDYGDECRDDLRKHGHAEPPPGEEATIALGRRMWEAWRRILLRVPPVECGALRPVRWPVQHGDFWSLVADTRPVVISSTTGRLIDGLARLNAHRAAGRRSPGVPVVRCAYRHEGAEFAAVIYHNAANPALPKVERVRLAELLRPAFRWAAARNSGRPAGEFTDLSGTLPAARRKKGAPVRVADRLAAVAGMSRPTYARWLAALREGGEAVRDLAAAEPAAEFWRDVGTAVDEEGGGPPARV